VGSTTPVPDSHVPAEAGAAGRGPGAGVILAGRYQLERPIAKGGMAEVWEAHDAVLARAVAVKVLHAHLASDRAFIERFRREAIAAARLAHPGVVATFDAATEGDDAYIVMELIRGRTLRQMLDEDGPLPVARAVTIAMQVAEALGHAHGNGIVHRDVKPGNILLCDEPDSTIQAKVVDFGIAKAAAEWGHDLTKTGAVLGTAKYLSPEQVQGGEPDARSDLYALGVVLYEMLTGQPPFQGASEFATAAARLDQDPVPPRRLRAGIPSSLERIVLRALARDPSDRPQTAAAFGAELAEVDLAADDATSLVAPDPTPQFGVVAAPRAPRRSRIPIVLAVALALALATVVGLLAVRNGDGTKTAASPTAPGAGQALKVVAATAFDPQGDGDEHNNEAAKAIDANPNTGWETQSYRARRFSGLKQGVGLVLQLDSARPVRRLHVLSPTRGWSAQVYVATSRGAALADWGQPVTQQTGINGEATFDLGGRTGGAVLLWLTDPGSANHAEINEVTVAS
jgi:tRNA A-37 threonylcarbamoyl transferase component Bud32